MKKDEFTKHLYLSLTLFFIFAFVENTIITGEWTDDSKLMLLIWLVGVNIILVISRAIYENDL